MITTEVLKLLTDETVSDWLKAALAAALCRDIVDAAQDAETLAKALKNRVEATRNHEMD